MVYWTFHPSEDDELPGIPGDLEAKSKLSPCSCSEALTQLNSIPKKGS